MTSPLYLKDPILARIIESGHTVGSKLEPDKCNIKAAGSSADLASNYVSRVKDTEEI